VEAKMVEWIENGVELGWILETAKRRVHIYRSTTEVEILENPDSVTGEGPLATFTLDLTRIWITRW
jgi:Putative restriction endonuclease